MPARIDDLLTGVDGFPPGDVLRLWLADGSRVIVRPSGTEPKVNVYLGEESGFDYEHGFYIEAIQRETVIFPAGWQDRLVRFECGIPGKAYGVSGFCLEPHDLCVSKALAGREKDWEFIRALVTAGVVQADVIHERITGTIEWPPHYEFDVSIAVERAASTILGF